MPRILPPEIQILRDQTFWRRKYFVNNSDRRRPSRNNLRERKLPPPLLFSMLTLQMVSELFYSRVGGDKNLPKIVVDPSTNMLLLQAWWNLVY